MSESDGVDEFVGGGMRVAVTAAAVVGERIAQARAEQARQAQAASIAEAQEGSARLTAERNAARAQLALVEQDGWWRSAGIDDVADAWETAQSWRAVDPEADRALDRIRSEVRDRYGVDVDDVGGLDRDALERAVTERQAAAEDRLRGRKAGEALEAAVVLAIHEADPAAELEVGVQRAELNNAMSGVADHESAEARLLAQAAGGGEAAPDEAARRAAMTKATGSAPAEARAVADQLNAKPVTAAPAAGKAALRAPKARRAPDRSAERARGR